MNDPKNKKRRNPKPHHAPKQAAISGRKRSAKSLQVRPANKKPDLDSIASSSHHMMTESIHVIPEARAVNIATDDAGVFDAARNHWLTGNWDELSGWHISEFSANPKRARIALLVGSALHEVGDYDGEKELLRLALEWGALRRDLLNVMIGQAHAALGRARLLAKHFEQAEKHFLAWIQGIAPNSAAQRYAKEFVFRESVAIGLLADAVNLIKQEVQGFSKRALHQPEASVLETKLTFLSQQLALAIQRNQLTLPKIEAEKCGIKLNSELTNAAKIKNKSVAQLGQDLWVAEQTNFRQSGFFVDIGATDGVLLNNTFLLEKEFEWSGICVEPNPESYMKLRKNRSCVVSDECIAGESGKEVEFILANEFGGISEYCNDMHDGKRKAFRDIGKTLMMKTTSLNDFLKMHNAPRTIDYLSLDTEGSEYEILKNFPFDHWNVRLITVEHNFTPLREKIHELLTAKGYSCKEAQWDDWYKNEKPG
jgi:FkbM family methyltransferase